MYREQGQRKEESSEKGWVPAILTFTLLFFQEFLLVIKVIFTFLLRMISLKYQ